MGPRMFDRLCQVAIDADDQDSYTITPRDAENIVRAVLKELREPTEKMIAAAQAECHRNVGVIDPVMHVWDAMIDAALSPTQEP